MREFSVTSGTVFHSRKLTFKKLLVAIWEDLTAVKGIAALHLTRKIGVEPTTALDTVSGALVSCSREPCFVTSIGPLGTAAMPA